jgi:hypothetical protein
MIAGLPEQEWRALVAHLSALPVEGILRLAESLQHKPVRLVELLLPHARAGSIRPASATDSPAVLAALLVVGAPAPALIGSTHQPESFHRFVSVTKRVPRDVAVKVVIKALRLLREKPRDLLIEALHQTDRQTFRMLVEAIVTDSAGPVGPDGPDLLPALTAQGPAVVAEALLWLGSRSAPETLTEAVRRLPARQRLKVATELDRGGAQDLARQVMGVEVWVPGETDPTSLFVADTFQRAGVLSGGCLLFPSDEEALQRIRRRSGLRHDAVLYAILSSGTHGTPMVVFTYYHVTYMATGMLRLPTRIPYAELIHLDFAAGGPDRLSVTRPGRPADSWDLSGTGVTPAQLIQLLLAVRDAFARGGP